MVLLYKTLNITPTIKPLKHIFLILDNFLYNWNFNEHTKMNVTDGKSQWTLIGFECLSCYSSNPANIHQKAASYFIAPTLLSVIFGQHESTVIFLESSSFLHGNPSKQHCSELPIVEW